MDDTLRWCPNGRTGVWRAFCRHQAAVTQADIAVPTTRITEFSKPPVFPSDHKVRCGGYPTGVADKRETGRTVLGKGETACGVFLAGRVTRRVGVKDTRGNGTRKPVFTP